MTVAVLLGAPGAGKGTQAPLLAEKLAVPVLASGDLLRAEVASGSEVGREVDAIMRSGELVPDDVMAGLFLARIDQPDALGGAILDGFPRTRRQAEALDAALDASGRPVDRALLIEVPVEHLIGRFAGRLICKAGGHVYNEWFKPPKVWGVCDDDGSELVHRADDAEATVRARMEQQLGPLHDVVDYYRGQGILAAVDGLQPIEGVTGALLGALGWETAPQAR
ncbi:MAG TPA: nucleoside monophosphate kinase [Candidatus Limnocylindrales bacterium]|jgi:adenylate kinase|nr:nucleoside monophosphate kinase [Candidatus Limnocylindrales bacterium]